MSDDLLFSELRAVAELGPFSCSDFTTRGCISY